MISKNSFLKFRNLVDGPISAEVISVEADAIVKEGRELAKLHKNIVVKCPLIPEGLKATKRLTAEGIRVNVTLCFSRPKRCWRRKRRLVRAADLLDASMTSAPTGWNSFDKIIAIYHNYDFKTKVLVASVRHTMHVVEAALAGGNICTMPYSVDQQLIKHPLTDIGLEKIPRRLKRSPPQVID